MAKSLISIIEIANVICEDVGDHTKKHQKIILRHLARCYKDLHLFMTPVTTVKTVCLPYGNCIQMPADFVYETKVGIMQFDKLVLLKKNYDHLGNIPPELNQSQFQNYVTDGFGMDIDENFTAFYNYNGEIVLKAVGLGVTSDDLYTVDTNRGVINLGSMIPKGCDIVVEYKSDGISEGLKLVPIEMESALYNYGLWKYYFLRSDGRYKQSEYDYDVAYYQLESLYRFRPIDYTSKLYNGEKGTINGLL